jgi:hypothetical protein
MPARNEQDWLHDADDTPLAGRDPELLARLRARSLLRRVDATTGYGSGSWTRDAPDFPDNPILPDLSILMPMPDPPSARGGIHRASTAARNRAAAAARRWACLRGAIGDDLRLLRRCQQSVRLVCSRALHCIAPFQEWTLAPASVNEPKSEPKGTYRQVDVAVSSVHPRQQPTSHPSLRLRG